MISRLEVSIFVKGFMKKRKNLEALFSQSAQTDPFEDITNVCLGLTEIREYLTVVSEF